jgi:hypothetical protein
MTQTQDEFSQKFRAYMVSPAAYKPLSDYIKGLLFDALRECFLVYFDLSKDYTGRDEHKRSLKIFFELSSAAIQRWDKYFALRFDALVRFEPTIWHSLYAQLDPTLQRELSRQIRRQKAALSPIQKAFLDKFDSYMKLRTMEQEKRLANWLGKLLKFNPLHDCLLAYVEASQRFPDNDKNSITVFMGCRSRHSAWGRAPSQRNTLRWCIPRIRFGSAVTTRWNPGRETNSTPPSERRNRSPSRKRGPFKARKLRLSRNTLFRQLRLRHRSSKSRVKSCRQLRPSANFSANSKNSWIRVTPNLSS